MAEANVEPAPTNVPEANEANDATATDVQPDASANATAPVPPPRPHTIEQAFYQGELSLSDGQFWFLRLLPDLSLTIMWSTCLRFKSQNQGCQGFQVLPTPSGPSMLMASRATIPSLTAPRTPTPSQEYHQIGSGAINKEAITHACYMIKGAFSLICALTLKPLLDCHA